MTSSLNGLPNGSSSKTNGASSSTGLRKDASERVVTADTINPAVLKAEYAVRGEIALRAEQLREECATDEGKRKLGFNQVISCNIGNPQQLGQKPVTFFRQVRPPSPPPLLLRSRKLIISRLLSRSHPCANIQTS